MKEFYCRIPTVYPGVESVIVGPWVNSVMQPPSCLLFTLSVTENVGIGSDRSTQNFQLLPHLQYFVKSPACTVGKSAEILSTQSNLYLLVLVQGGAHFSCCINCWIVESIVTHYIISCFIC